MNYQLSNLFFLCPSQQATTCSACSTQIYNTTPSHGKYHSSQIDITIRTLMLETSKRGRLNAPTILVHQEVARETSMPLFLKNQASHLLRGECQVVRIGKRSPKWQWLKTKKGKACENRIKEGLRTRVRTSGKINSPPGQPNLHSAGSRGGEKIYKKRSQN